jgi:hypothetical protein
VFKLWSESEGFPNESRLKDWVRFIVVWWIGEARLAPNTFLQHSLSEYIKVAELAVVMVLGSVQDERTFNTFDIHEE